MSNFSVLVIGDNPEQLMQPFHEFETTGVDDQFVQDVDMTQSALASFQQSEGMTISEFIPYYYSYPVFSDESQAAKSTPETGKWGYAIVQNSTLVKVVQRTNPNAKWDWHSTSQGYRRGFLRTKSGEYSDSARRNEAVIRPKAIANHVSAVIQNGVWTSQGDLPEKEWEDLIRFHISDSPSDALLTVYHCHI